MRPIDRVLERLPSAKRNGGGWRARCPAHDDRAPSLSVGVGEDGRVLLKCHAGCANEAIVAALGLEMADLFERDGPQQPSARPPQGEFFRFFVEARDRATTLVQHKHGTDYKLVTAYDYPTANGAECLKVLRFEGAGGKTFRPLGCVEGMYRLGDPPGPLPLFKLPQIHQRSQEPVLVVEGEKAAMAGAELGLLTTTSSHGAAAAKRTDWSPLAGRAVVIWPDKDDPGAGYAREVLGLLQQLSPPCGVRLLVPPDDLPHGGDLHDFVETRKAQGLDEEQILSQAQELLARAAAPPPISQPIEDPPPSSGWPDPPSDEAFHGLAGEFVRLVEPHSEADPVALLVQFLIGAGSVIGRGPHVLVESDEHHCNLFAVMCGRSSKARKGTSFGRVEAVLKLADPVWAEHNPRSGFASGEGLIHAVRDRRVKLVDGEDGLQNEEMLDEGVADKRMLAFEGEFAAILRILQREGNNLSPLIRNAWDGRPLENATKNNPAKATGAHISIIGHITKDEAQRYLDRTEAGNGFGNRILWVCVQRSKLLPEGGQLPLEALQAMARRLEERCEWARYVDQVGFDEEARVLWHQVYGELSGDRPGLLGAMVGRAEAQVLRLALLHALLDRKAQIGLVHLRAALALWRYCEDSARYVFGDSLGDPLADVVLKALRDSEDGLNRTALHAALGRNVKVHELDRALGVLREQQLAHPSKAQSEGGGRPSEIWRATKETKEPKKLPACGPVPSSTSFLSYRASVARGAGAGAGAGADDAGADEWEEVA